MRASGITSRRETLSRAASRFRRAANYSPRLRSRRTIDRLLKRRGWWFPFRFPNSAAARDSFCYRRTARSHFLRGVPGQVLDLSRESPDVAASYALFRRYLFDYRTQLLLPMLILIDEFGLAHKVYPAVPSESRLMEDLRLLKAKDRQRLAFPFPGQYYTAPQRNQFSAGRGVLLGRLSGAGVGLLERSDSRAA